MKERILLILSLILMTGSFTVAQTAKRTITNADLEKFRQKRVQAEADYRANYKRLGMPSPEELARQEAERQAWLTEFSRQAAADNRQTEDYFAAQANQLKSQIINVQAQINYLRGQAGNLPEQNSVFLRPEQLSGVIIGGNYGYYPNNRIGGGRRYNNSRRAGVINVNPATNVQAAINNAASAPNPYAGTAQAQTGVKVVIGQPNVIRRSRGYRRGYGYGGYGGYPVPYALNNNSNQRDDLVSRLGYLEQTKAGLLAQLAQVREEARRSGIRID